MEMGWVAPGKRLLRWKQLHRVTTGGSKARWPFSEGHQRFGPHQALREPASMARSSCRCCFLLLLGGGEGPASLPPSPVPRACAPLAPPLFCRMQPSCDRRAILALRRAQAGSPSWLRLIELLLPLPPLLERIRRSLGSLSARPPGPFHPEPRLGRVFPPL